MYADHLLKPWLDCILADLQDVAIFDAHTHVGENDPSGFTATFEELERALDLVDGRAAVFPLAEPGGYRQVNLACAEAASRTPRRLTAFARITPQQDPNTLLAEAMAAGARGVKLHPSSDEFDLDDHRLTRVYEVAEERRLPVIVHAGPELDGIGEMALTLCSRHPDLLLVLAHCALTDLGWIWRHVPETPNLFFDTSWWTPAHLMTLFTLVPPGRVLSASDLPYSTPLWGSMVSARCAYQAGLDREQVKAVLGGQFARLVDGQPPLELGPPPGPERRLPSPALEMLSTNLLACVAGMHRGEDPGVPLRVARHACKVSDDDPAAPVVASVERLIDLYAEHRGDLPARNPYSPGWDLIAAAAIVARTPAAPLP
jgi:hypothetical protein